MPTWLVAVLGGGGAVTALIALVRHWMNLRFYRRTYDRGGPDDMLAASQAVHLENPTALARARTALRRRARRTRRTDDEQPDPPPEG